MRVAVIGVVMGAVLTSQLVGSASAGATGVTEQPTLTGVLIAENTTFVETSIHMNSGEVLGLFIVNKERAPTPSISTVSTSTSSWRRTRPLQ